MPKLFGYTGHVWKLITNLSKSLNLLTITFQVCLASLKFIMYVTCHLNDLLDLLYTYVSFKVIYGNGQKI